MHPGKKNPRKDSPLSVKPVPAPKLWPDTNTRLILGFGAQVDPIVRLNTFSAEQFENFTNQWIEEDLAMRYVAVEERHGAGDKGRDIIAWVDPKGTANRVWDNYQCKHYDKALTPTSVYLELGKLCFYTHRGDFTIPRKYYFVCNRGLGTDLADLIQTPNDLRQKLIDHWDKYCTKKITTTQDVPLTGIFKQYVEDFDFSILDQIPVKKMLDLHAKTRYHAQTFGTALKPRPAPLLPPTAVAFEEHRYVEQLLEAYGDHDGSQIDDVSKLTADGEDYLGHFNEARRCFYSAESLKEFARDNLPPQQDWFAELTSHILAGIDSTLRKDYKSGYERLLATTQTAGSLPLGYHVLRDDFHPPDRVGVCHQLANEDKLKWVRKKKKKKKPWYLPWA